MATVKEMFNSAVSEAMKNAELISDNYQKAMVYASVAQALAATGMMTSSGSEIVAEEIATPEEKKASKPKKTADKLKRQPEEIPAEEPKKEKAAKELKEEKTAEEPQKEEAAEEKDYGQEWTDEWTEEALTAFAEELQYISDFAETYGIEAANEVLSEFSNGKLKDIVDDINPLNIRAVVSYFNEVAAA